MAKIAALPELDTERNIKYEENIKYMRHVRFGQRPKKIRSSLFDERYRYSFIKHRL